MNCFEVRHILLTQAENQQLIEKHLQNCASCQQFTQELHTQNALLKTAVNIPTPPHLAERILLNTQLAKRSYWHVWALAASLILAISVITFNVRLLPTSPVWHEVILAHVLNERATLDLNKPIAHSQLTQAIASFGLKAKYSLGDVYYVEHCDMPYGKGLHVVLNTQKFGKITLIIPPHDVDIETGFSQREGFNAHMIMLGHKAIGIVATQTIKQEDIKQWLADNLLLS